jgi:polyphosphate kinase
MRKIIDHDRSRLLPRELSWLAFNDRVLEEASDTTNPLLERMRFLAIVSSNLEEFFRVRVANLLRLQNRDGKKAMRDGVPVSKLLDNIRYQVFDQKHRQGQVFDQLCLELGRAGLSIEMGPSDLGRTLFEDKILPHLVPVRITAEDALPPIKGSHLYCLAEHPNSFSLIEIPAQLPRIFVVRSKHVFLTDQLMATYRHLLFGKQEVNGVFFFKASRDAQIEVDDESDDPLAEMELGLKDRETGDIVRLEIDSTSVGTAVDWLVSKLRVPSSAVYQLSLPLDLKGLMPIADIKRFKRLRYPYPEPRRPSFLPPELGGNRFFKALEQRVVLLHHPYVSFDPVVDLLRHAADDPKVTRIYQTLYRTSRGSPLLESLMQAARKGKKVIALVEIKARFDEANNIRWARALEKAGVRVIYGTPELKLHAKLTYVERKEPRGGAFREYVHVGTGNYHPSTARLYTDLGMMTTSPEHCHDARQLFDLIEEMDDKDSYHLLSEPQAFASKFKHWVVAPALLHVRVIEWIKNETAMARAGKPAGIRAKMNGLVEESIVEALYEASQAGVKIDLLVRGMCCVRPGVPGLSENIRVRSLVDRYLEHSRVFMFENGGDRKVWISSADWMPRNLFRRIELAVPILNTHARDYLSDVYWPTYQADNVKARECLETGHYQRILPWGDQNTRAQFAFEKLPVPEFPVTRPATTAIKS